MNDYESLFSPDGTSPYGVQLDVPFAHFAPNGRSGERQQDQPDHAYYTGLNQLRRDHEALKKSHETLKRRHDALEAFVRQHLSLSPVNHLEQHAIHVPPPPPLQVGLNSIASVSSVEQATPEREDDTSLPDEPETRTKKRARTETKATRDCPVCFNADGETPSSAGLVREPKRHLAHCSTSKCLRGRLLVPAEKGSAAKDISDLKACECDDRMLDCPKTCKTKTEDGCALHCDWRLSFPGDNEFHVLVCWKCLLLREKPSAEALGAAVARLNRAKGRGDQPIGLKILSPLPEGDKRPPGLYYMIAVDNGQVAQLERPKGRRFAYVGVVARSNRQKPATHIGPDEQWMLWRSHVAVARNGMVDLFVLIQPSLRDVLFVDGVVKSETLADMLMSGEVRVYAGRDDGWACVVNAEEAATRNHVLALDFASDRSPWVFHKAREAQDDDCANKALMVASGEDVVVEPLDADRARWAPKAVEEDGWMMVEFLVEQLRWDKVLLERGETAAPAVESAERSKSGDVEAERELAEMAGDVKGDEDGGDGADEKDATTDVAFQKQRFVSLLKAGRKKGAKEFAERVGLDLDVSHTTLLETAKSGDVFAVSVSLLAEVVDVDMRDDVGATPLCWASLGGHLDVVNVLLDKGADIEACDNNGWTPLYAASESGHVDVVNVLLEKGADISACEKKGWTPLHLASGNGHLDLVNVLLDKGADISACKQDDWTPLHVASRCGHLDVVNVLLDKGADIEACDEDGRTGLHCASRYGHENVVNVLLEKGADIEACKSDGETPLHLASRCGHVDVVNVLLDKDIDIKACAQDGCTPLHLASCRGHVDVVNVLLDKGADIEACKSDGETPLHLASRYGHVDVMIVLLDKHPRKKRFGQK